MSRRSVDHDVALVGIDLNHGRRCARAREFLERPERRSGTADAEILCRRWQFFLHAGDRGLILRTDDDERWGAVGEHIGHLIGVEPPVHRQHDGADQRRGTVKIGELQAIARRDRDPVARLHALRRKPRGEAFGPLK